MQFGWGFFKRDMISYLEDYGLMMGQEKNKRIAVVERLDEDWRLL